MKTSCDLISVHQCERIPCPTCTTTGMEVVLRLHQLPVHCNILHRDREAALTAPTANVELAFCSSCGMIYNVAFDETRLQYGEEYENALGHSRVFQEYQQALIKRLSSTFSLSNSTVLEIGSGDGRFLSELCSVNGASGFGFDPSGPQGNVDANPNVCFNRTTLDAHSFDGIADLICFRHVLEHVPHPRAFLDEVVAVARHGGQRLVYCEVPAAEYMIAKQSVWDILYEHCSYFSASSLRYLFTAAGIPVLRTESAYDGQYLQLDAQIAGDDDKSRPFAGYETATPTGSDVSLSRYQVRQFAADCQAKIDAWRRRIDALHRRQQRVVVWGAGTKGVSFVNMLDLRDEVRYIVDINPAKHGRFVSTTGQQVVGPHELPDIAPTHVVLMNPIYADEIRGILTELGLKNVDIMTVN